MTGSHVFHLAIAFDQNYLSPFYALITSVFDNNPGLSITVHAIATGVAPSDQVRIEEYVQEHQSIIYFYQIDQELISRFVLGSKWTMAVYYRLFFPFVVPPDVSHLLYIDTDTLVVGHLQSFEELNLGEYPVAAVYDNWVKTQPLLGITEEGEYFNSGVLYIHLAEWRRQRISEQAFDYLLQFPERIKFVDQCALNAVLRHNWMCIDYRFNTLYSYIPEALSRQEFDSFLNDKIILHFTLQRPWAMLCQNRFRYLYTRYLRSSPGAKRSLYNDFAMAKLPKLIQIRLRELYFDNPQLTQQWRRLKDRFA